MTKPTEGAPAASVHSTCEVRYLVRTSARRHQVDADEPEGAGGGDAAATPLELLATGLSACTAITLRMYAERKGWDLGAVEVDCRVLVEGTGYRFERVVKLGHPLDEAQRTRLAEIAEKTPVTRIVKAGGPVRTEVR